MVTVLHSGSGPSSTVTGRPLELTYLTMRGLAELPRLIMEEAGLAYIGTYYGREKFAAAKQSLPMGRVPVLKGVLPNGAELSQSASIVRVLARKAGLDGTDDVERAVVDSWYETYKELFGTHSVWGKAMNIHALKEGQGTDQGEVMHFRDMSNRGEYTDFQKAAAVLQTFEVALESSTSGFLVGASLTYVDLALWMSLLELEEEDNMPNWADALNLPALKKFKDQVENRPNLQAYLQSDRLMPRIKKEDGDYVYHKGMYSVPRAADQTDQAGRVEL